MITAELDERHLFKGLDEILRRADQDFLRAMAPEARKDQRDHASAQEGPESRWAPRDEVTQARLRKARKGRRRILGRLPGAIQVKVHPDAIEIESRVKWSGIHQEGGTANNGGQIPARPFLWWSEAFLTDAEAAALEYVLRHWGR